MKCALQLTFIIFLSSNMREVIHTDVRTRRGSNTLSLSLPLFFFFVCICITATVVVDHFVPCCTKPHSYVQANVFRAFCRKLLLYTHIAQNAQHRVRTSKQEAMSSSFGFNPIVRRPSRATNANALLQGTVGAHPSTTSPQSQLQQATSVHSSSSSHLPSKSRMFKSPAPQATTARPYPSLATVTRAAAASAPSTSPQALSLPPPSLPSNNSPSPSQPQQHQHQQHKVASIAPHIPFVDSIAGTSEHERERGDDHFHWVFATTREVLVDVHSGEEVAGPSERVLLVYPMHNDTEEGTVHMRLKQVDPVTAQLSLHWVTVYNSLTNERLVGDFSLIS